MSTGALIILLCILASVIASVLVASACILSARISNSEHLVEQYDDGAGKVPKPQVARRPYSLEG